MKEKKLKKKVQIKIKQRGTIVNIIIFKGRLKLRHKTDKKKERGRIRVTSRWREMILKEN